MECLMHFPRYQASYILKRLREEKEHDEARPYHNLMRDAEIGTPKKSLLKRIGTPKTQ